MSNYIIGTAGHVDHGKSALIKAITGVQTDRLKEEKERGISIELGFASFTLPSGNRAGVVDVPGHEKFVRQMLAGVGGIDLVLLVIAADEGVMPQTTEHLEIIDLLQIRKGIVVLNKIDLVDQEWAELVKSDIEQALKHTVLEGAEIIEVSALTGHGLGKLIEQIDKALESLPPRDYTGPCRMPIDRVFTLPGFGTIVTGTMYEGIIRMGETVIIEPGHLESRVRSLQVHGVKVDEAFAGQRVAVNLPNVEVAQVPRGASLLSPGFLEPVQTLDLSLRYLGSSPKSLVHRQRVRFHIGTQEVFGRIHLIDREEVKPGEKVYLQILLEEPVVAARGDRFVIRQYSPVRTIGGGMVLEGGNRKYKRYLPGVTEQMALQEKGTPKDLITTALRNATNPLSEDELAKLTGLNKETVAQTLTSLSDRLAKLELDGQAVWFEQGAVERWTRGVKQTLEEFHKRFCLRPGLPKEEFKAKFFKGWNSKLFSGFINYLGQHGVIQSIENFVALPDFTPGPRDHLAKVMDDVLQEYRVAGLNPPEWSVIAAAHNIAPNFSEELLQYLLRQGALVKLDVNLYFAQEAVDKARSAIKELLKEKGGFSTAEAKEKLNTSRKYLIPLLEYFDRLKLTRRVNDRRVKF